MSRQINLFNPIFLKQEKQFSALAMAQTLGVILFCAILLTLYTRYQLSNLEAEKQSTTTQLQLAQNQLVKVMAEYGPRQKDPALAAQLRHAELEVQSLQQISKVLGEGDFGNTKGYSSYLSAFARQITGGIWLTGFSILGAGGEIAIQGSALRPELVPLYLSRLKTEPVMQGASFAALEMQLPKPVEEKNATENDKKRMVQPAYINFNLRSSAAPKGQTLSGAASQ
jgi:Tfp pilus assembly protein PilN